MGSGFSSLIKKSLEWNTVKLSKRKYPHLQFNYWELGLPSVVVRKVANIGISFLHSTNPKASVVQECFIQVPSLSELWAFAAALQVRCTTPASEGSRYYTCQELLSFLHLLYTNVLRDSLPSLSVLEIPCQDQTLFSLARSSESDTVRSTNNSVLSLPPKPVAVHTPHARVPHSFIF